jgi:hypothetical protein
VGVAVGAAVLVPSLVLLYSLVLRGRLDSAGAGAGAAVDVVTEPGERAPVAGSMAGSMAGRMAGPRRPG